MTYEISKQIRIHNTEDDWDYNFKTDEYGTVDVTVGVDEDDGIRIPKDCIQHFIDALEQFKK
jgi:hypothetical protein